MMSAWAEAGSKENQATGTHKQHQVSPAGARPSVTEPRGADTEQRMRHAGPTRRATARRGLGLRPTGGWRGGAGQGAAERRGLLADGGHLPSWRDALSSCSCSLPARLGFYGRDPEEFCSCCSPVCLRPPPAVCLSELVSPQDPGDLLKFGPSRRRRGIPGRSPGCS